MTTNHDAPAIEPTDDKAAITPAPNPEDVSDDYADDWTDEQLAKLAPEEAQVIRSGRDAAREAAEAEANAAAAAAAPPPEPAPAPEPAPEPAAPALPDVTDAQKVLDSFDAAKKALIDQFRDGMDEDEHAEALEALIEQRAQAKAQIAEHERLAAAAETSAADAWYGAVTAYMGATPELAGEKPGGGFDTHLRNVAAAPEHQHLSNEQVIRLAHAKYAEEQSLIGNKLAGPAAAQAAPATPAKTEAKPAEAAPTPRPMPPSLANVPASDLSDGSGRFAHLDRLEGTELEAAMAAMSPAEQRAYLASA